MDKYKEESKLDFCEQEKVEEKSGYQSRNYKQNGSIKGEGDALHPGQGTGSITRMDSSKPHTVKQTYAVQTSKNTIK
eukprot:15126675-Heterocapsa_arctica.AAC.1